MKNGMIVKMRGLNCSFDISACAVLIACSFFFSLAIAFSSLDLIAWVYSFCQALTSDVRRLRRSTSTTSLVTPDEITAITIVIRKMERTDSG